MSKLRDSPLSYNPLAVDATTTQSNAADCSSPKCKRRRKRMKRKSKFFCAATPVRAQNNYILQHKVQKDVKLLRLYHMKLGYGVKLFESWLVRSVKTVNSLHNACSSL